MKKIVICFSSVLFALLMCFCGIVLYFEESNKLEYRASDLTYVNYTINRPENTTKTSLKLDIDALFDNPKYSLSECDLKYPLRGRAEVITRTIQVDLNLSLEYFVFVLAHEIIHIKYLTKSERFCNIKAFETLYNSNNDYFKNIALMFADYDIRGYFDYEYSFVGYLTEILEDNNAIKTK